MTSNSDDSSTCLDFPAGNAERILSDGTSTLLLNGNNSLTIATHDGKTTCSSPNPADERPVSMKLEITVGFQTGKYTYQNSASLLDEKTKALGSQVLLYYPGVFEIPSKDGKSQLYSLLGTWWPTDTADHYIRHYSRTLHGSGFNGPITIDKKTDLFSGLTLGWKGPSTNQYSFLDMDQMVQNSMEKIRNEHTSWKDFKVEKARERHLKYLFGSATEGETCRQLKELRSGQMVMVPESLIESRLGLKMADITKDRKGAD